MPPRVILIGAPGSGKTTVGTLLALRWQTALRESDDQVEAAAEASISDIYVDEGEAGFRRREVDAAREVLGTEGTVVTLGGGAVESPATRELLKSASQVCPVVYLAVGASESGKRMGITGIRPVGLGNVRSQWNAMMTRRRPLYEEVATVTVDTDRLSPDEVSAVVAAQIAEPS